MAKILDSQTITGAIQKVVETPSGYIMNGSYYDKNQMIPKPLQLFPVLGDVVDLSMNKKTIINHALANHGKTMGDTIITDRYDPTICYVWVLGARANFTMLFKIQENNGGVSILNSTTYTGVPTSNPMVRAYCGQDTNFLYYIMSCAGTYHEYLVKIDKASLTMTTVEDFSTYAWGSAIKETDTHFYFGRKQGYGTNVIKRYNKTTSVLEIIPVTAKTSNIYFSTCYSNLLSNSDTDFYTYTLYHNQTTNKFGITRYHFDTTQSTLANIVAEADCNITWGSITQLPVFASNVAVTYEPFITIANNGNKYLNIAIYENANSSTAVNLPQYGIYTFYIDPSTYDLTFKNFLQVTSDYFRGFLSVRDNTFLIGASSNTCYFINFDATNEKFVITDTLNNQPSHIGADQSENIWIVNSLKEVEMLSPFIPTNINVNYELQGYKYQGVDINTYITVEAKNYSGANIASNLQLTIKGNAVFTSNGSKSFTDSTLATGVKQIPITIKGAGAITVYPQLIM